MKNIMKGIFTFLLMLSFDAFSSVVTVNPKTFGTAVEINELSDYVNISRGYNLPVYSTEWHKKGSADLTSTIENINPVGQKVFSFHKEDNSEWMFNFLEIDHSKTSNINTLKQYDSGSLILDFKIPISSITLYTAELFQDAGWGSGSDPLLVFLYNKSGDLISYQNEGTSYPIEHNINYIPPSIHNPFSYTISHFSFPEIYHVAIGGFSEPTTIGKFDFTIATVSEPNTLVLLSSLFIFALARTLPLNTNRSRKQSFF